MKKSVCLMISVLFQLLAFFAFSPAVFCGEPGTPHAAPVPDKEAKAPRKPPVPAPDAKKAIEAEDFSYKDIAFFIRTLAVIRASYVDKEKVSNDELLRKALRGLLRELDPFSAYESPDELKVMRESSRGNFAGIGVTIAGRNQIIEVVSVFEGSPAEKAGLRVGDFIGAVDGKPVSGFDIPACVKLMKGGEGTLVKLKVFRRGLNAPLEIAVRRGLVKVSSVVNPAVLDGRFGYLRIAQFSATTPDDLLRELKKLRGKKIAGLIIDLRNNPGGLLHSAIGSCSIFLRTGQEVVSTNGRLPSSRRIFSAVDIPKCLDLPVVILINGNSASAAEIFAGCLRDHKRAVLVGSKSFGKGSVQTIMPLAEMGAMRLTTAKYYTPSKKVIHGVGIMPDIVVGVPPKLQFELNTGFLNRSVRPGAEFDRLAAGDIQLRRAVDILKGITLFERSEKK